MLAVRVIPCLDIRDGEVVKGVRFSNLSRAGDVVQLATRYESEGADELIVLDVKATPEGRGHRSDVIKSIRQYLSIPLTVGGGVRHVSDARALLEAGADKVAVNTAAVTDPSLISAIASNFGRQCTVVAVDAAQTPSGGWEVVVRSGRVRTGLDAVSWVQSAVRAGAGEILLTSWDRDGTGAGYDLDLITAICNAITVPVIASGGAREPEDFVAAADRGATGLLAASIFHYRRVSIREIKDALARSRHEVRHDCTID